MTPERWQQIEKIFHEALDYRETARTDFLDQACANDPDLRKEVETLLAAEEVPIGLQGVVDAARSLAKRETNRIGLQLGPYKILSEIGSGGVGVVYLAEDTRLGRRVAIKMLLAYFIQDENVLRRFQSEARTASSLTHPNIITIHDVGELDHVPYVVSEYVEGQTLSQRIAEQSLTPYQILDIVLQIADALDEAHSHGIIHRDIKPPNIMLTTRGQVKVLDFGLAKMLQSSSQDRRTIPGVLMGTVTYMSPEQALGKDVDHRTDLFSFGTLFYEMLARSLPFDGASYEEVLTNILKQEPPPIRNLDSDLARRMEQIILKLLQKDRDRRYQSAREVIKDLQLLKMNSDAALLSRVTVKLSLWRITWKKKAVFAAAVISILAAAGFFLRHSVRWKGPLPKATFTQLTDNPGVDSFCSLAPDGRSFVYERNGDIYLQRAGGKNAVNLTPDYPDVDSQPAFSPDGNSIAFYSKRNGGGIFVMEATGENATRLSNFGYNPAWSPDSSQVVFATDPVIDPLNRGGTSQLWVVQVQNRQKRLLFTGDAVQPNWSPHGSRIAYWGLRGGQRDIWTSSAKGGDAVQLTNDPYLDFGPVWSPEGNYLYFASDRGGSVNFWRIPIDEETGKSSGSPEPVTTPSEQSKDISFSKDGKHIAFTKVLSRQNLQKADFDPETESLVGKPAWISQVSQQLVGPSLSPDAQWIVFNSLRKQEDICVIKSDGTGLHQLTNDVFKDRIPEWSPDGKQIAFYSDRTGHYEIWTVHSDGSGLKRMTFVSGPIVGYPVWSPDSKKIAYAAQDLRVYVMDTTKPWSKKTVEMLPWAHNTKSWFNLGSWSPDGKKLLGWIDNLDPPERTGLVVYTFATKQYKRVLNYGQSATWLSDSRRVIFGSKDKIQLLDTETGNVKDLLSLDPYTSDICMVSSDNHSIYYSLEWVESDIWLMTLED